MKLFLHDMFCKNLVHDGITSISTISTNFKICRFVIYSFVQMVMKQKFGTYADENGEKALHTLPHVMLKNCGCGLFHICCLLGLWCYKRMKFSQKY